MMLQKISVAIVTFILCSSLCFGQKNNIALHGGLAETDLGDTGSAFDISYERTIHKNLRIGLTFGTTGSNDFPDSFQVEQRSNNGVPAEIDQYILELQPSTALLLGWSSRNEGYAQLYLKYQLPFRFSDFQIDIAAGASYFNGKVVHFTLRSFTFNTITGEMLEYEPKFSFGHQKYLAGLLAAGVSRPITEKYTFHANAKLTFGSPVYDGFGASQTFYRLGVSMKF